MKKSLLAFALLGAFAGAASAQTNVTIYGVADVGLERVKLSPGQSTTGLTSGIQSGSRLGFKGTEDLGGGMAAIFALENGFDISTGAAAQGGTLFGRQAWVGLKGGFGTVKLGRQYTPLFIALDTIDPMGTGLSGGGNGIAAVFNPGVGYTNPRMNNTINYSFAAAGVTGELAYGLGEVAGSNRTGREIGANVGYANGPITAVVAYDDKNDTAIGSQGNIRTWMLGGAYDLHVAKLHAAFADNRGDNAVGATALRSRDWMLGVSAPVGGTGTVLASYVRHDDRLSTGAVDADYWQLGYTHGLSKRTNLYTSYSKLNNKPAGSVDTSWLNVGIRHKF
ncbi:porin [Noviherbaspirillum sp.]|uniref:porin n=1 Tax=Noviherbaspirillum sp. TaxID=1926288 RepID=UPI002B4661B8|nr:porin [Noviherbaspirillum sp.]HJV81116.1 porin [Noviherbaspirillum sp.]